MNYISMPERIGNKIRELRKKAGWTQETLAKEMHMSESSRSTVRSWEKGDRLPTSDQLIQLCNLFHCDIGCLFGDYEARYRSIADISELTGLSESTILSILSIKKNAPSLLSILGSMIESSSIGLLLAEIQSCKRNMDLAKKNTLKCDGEYQIIKDEAEKRGWSLMTFTDIALQHKAEAENEARRIIEELTGIMKELEV